MEIEYYTKQVYGTDMHYIKDQEIHNIVWSLTGRKTITDSDMGLLAKLGCTFTEVIAPRG